MPTVPDDSSFTTLVDEQAAGWRSGRRPSLESLLQRADLAQRETAFVVLLGNELRLRRELGESPRAADYEDRFPGRGELVRSALDSLGPWPTSWSAATRLDIADSPDPVAPVVSPDADPFATQRAHDTSDTAPEADFATVTEGGLIHRATSDAKESAGRFGQYELVRLIGRGGMGLVYLARQPSVGRLVALKVIRNELLSDRQAMDRFRAEARAAARIEHDHLIPIYEVGEFGGRQYFSMKYIQGHSLQELLAQQGSLPFQTAARYISQASRGMAAAHRQQVLHRDIKPGNILIDGQLNRALITDFGLAKLQCADFSRADQMTRAGIVFGTPAYMAPEQTSDAGSVTASADIYSLGATLYHALAGRPVFAAESLPELLRCVTDAQPAALRTLNRDIPVDLETICHKCLEKAPRRRFATADELADELDRYLAGEPIRSRPVGLLERGARWIRRRPAVAAASLAFIGLLLLTFITAATLHGDRQARRKQEVVEQLHEELQQPRAESAYWAGIENRLSQLRSLDAAAYRRERERALKSFSGYVRDRVYSPVLADADQQQLESLLRELGPALGSDGQSYLDHLEQRRRRWRMVAEEPVGPHGLWPGIVKADRGWRLADGLAPSDSQLVWLATPWRWSQEGSRVEATFDDWKDHRQLAIAFRLSPTEAESPTSVAPTLGYVFLLQAGRGSATFSALERTNAPLRAVLMRDGQVLQRRTIHWSELSSPLVTLGVECTGARLRFYINEQSRLEYEELFAPRTSSRGDVAILLSPRTTLERVRLHQQSAALSPSPLEQGDLLFGEGNYAQAAQAYGSQAIPSGNPALGLEARVKQGICLLRQGLDQEAEQVLGSVALSEETGRWPIMATAQLWLMYLQGDRAADAESLLQSVKSRFSVAQLSEAIPDHQRQEIIDVYRRTVDGGYHTFRRDPQRVVKLQRAVEVQQLLAPDSEELFDTQMSLIQATWLAGDVEESINLCEQGLTQPGLSSDAKAALLSVRAWQLTSVGRPELAIDQVKQHLFGASGEIDLAYQRLIPSYAHLLVKLGHGDQALNFLRELDENLESTNIWISYQARTMYGLLWEAAGDHQRARMQWSRVLREARQRDNLHDLDAAIAAGLSGELSRADIDRMLFGVTAGNRQSAAMKFLAQGFAPESLIQHVPLHMWTNPRGKSWAWKIVFRDLSYGEFAYMQVWLAAYECHRQAIVQGTDPSLQLSPEQDQVAWALVQDHYEMYVEGKTGELELIQMVQTFKGVTGLFGWSGVADKLPEVVRRPYAYAMGRHYAGMGRHDDARMFYNTALQGEVSLPTLEKLAREQLNTDPLQ